MVSKLLDNIYSNAKIEVYLSYFNIKTNTTRFKTGNNTVKVRWSNTISNIKTNKSEHTLYSVHIDTKTRVDTDKDKMMYKCIHFISSMKHF